MQYTLKKSLGQHFLKDENICKQIVAALEKIPHKQLLEVGPGAGALTKYLLQIPATDFKAIEVDEEKVQYLQKTFPSINGKLIHQDFLEASIPFTDEFTVVGNFPYNISSQILFRLLDWKAQVPFIVGMFQKEVAQRVAATPNSKAYGIISVLMQFHYEVNYLFDVPPESFNPPPKVMSGVIQLTRKKETLAIKSERSFTVLVKTAFNQRRKMLRNPLKPLFEESFLKEDIFTKRAEQLSLEDFARLSFYMK